MSGFPRTELSVAPRQARFSRSLAHPRRWLLRLSPVIQTEDLGSSWMPLFPHFSPDPPAAPMSPPSRQIRIVPLVYLPRQHPTPRHRRLSSVFAVAPLSCPCFLPGPAAERAFQAAGQVVLLLSSDPSGGLPAPESPSAPASPPSASCRSLTAFPPPFHSLCSCHTVPCWS